MREFFSCQELEHFLHTLICIGQTVEIGVCAKPRLMPSGHLACHFVTLPPSLECHVRMAVVLLFAYAYAYAYDSPHVNCQNPNPAPPEPEIKYLLNPMAAWLGTVCRIGLVCPKLLPSSRESTSWRTGRLSRGRIESHLVAGWLYGGVAIEAGSLFGALPTRRRALGRCRLTQWRGCALSRSGAERVG